jgi:Phospholipase_D-nuclease N-terminal/Short C-terminal domain
MFIGVFADILRRDMSGWAKAGWIILILLLPFLGILIYLIARPATAEPRGWMFGERHGAGYESPGHGAADEIARAARLYDEGKITADEFERLKQRALSS